MSTGGHWRVTKQKGASSGAIPHLTNTLTILSLMWGSEIWWTRATHILDQIYPSYNEIAPIITRLPKWTPYRNSLPMLACPHSHWH